ncbi:hydantoinase B/oxoprolinase family protein [Halovivax gelatinilyticus]|uniref:hydantoinase B/oxoprolinase family protein n=1 Tax=Halovivax gelatinilyticus TaxID=2961597 RepID=UPI0020CA6FA0|nr:hydantoinase B/oxoprolinase family protein [Halovivax gelatinilyticus]
MTGASGDLDPATVAVVRNYLNSAATEMQRTLTRTAYNTIIYEIFDFGLSMYDADLRLLADSPGLSLFLGANDFSVRKGVEHVGEENLDPGDVIVLNYPYWNSSHTLDVCLFAPVFLDDELIGYTASRAHWLDLGAKDEGYVLDSTDMHQEGLIFPGTKVYKKGEPDEEILDIIRFNSRIPDKVIGDLNAQIAALRTGADRLRELHEKYGTETVDAAVDRIVEHGERTATEGIEALPDGTWSAVDYVDNDGVTDELVRIEVEVTIDGDAFTFDFSGSSDEVTGPINVPLGRTEAICKFCLKTLTTPEETTNHGHYEPIEIVVPEGNLFNAQYPSPTYTLWASMLAVDVVFKALAKAMPERIPASTGGDICSVMLYGDDPDTGRSFVEANNEAVGWGATDERDGPSALMHYVQTMVRNIPIEVFENKAPVEFDQLSLREDSGGPGERRGGLGVRRDYRLTHPADVLTIIKKTKTAGWGLDGGEPGAKNVVVLDLDDSDASRSDRIQVFADNNDDYPADDREWVGMMRGSFEPGEVVSNRSGGGGGYGDPFDRDPEAVREDVADGYVSREGAREDYGVVIDGGGEVDREATRSVRDEREN